MSSRHHENLCQQADPLQWTEVYASGDYRESHSAVMGSGGRMQPGL